MYFVSLIKIFTETFCKYLFCNNPDSEKILTQRARRTKLTSSCQKSYSEPIKEQLLDRLFCLWLYLSKLSHLCIIDCINLPIAKPPDKHTCSASRKHFSDILALRAVPVYRGVNCYEKHSTKYFKYRIRWRIFVGKLEFFLQKGMYLLN